MDRGVVYALFAREFSFTLPDCLAMTRWQQFLYLDRLGRLNAFERQAAKDAGADSAPAKEKAETFDDIARALPL